MSGARLTRDEPQLAVIGGGTGSYHALRGLKRHPVRLAAIVSVLDDGVTNLRGRIIPVVDLRERFDIPRAPHTSATRIASSSSQTALLASWWTPC